MSLGRPQKVHRISCAVWGGL